MKRFFAREHTFFGLTFSSQIAVYQGKMWIQAQCVAAREWQMGPDKRLIFDTSSFANNHIMILR